MFDFSFADFQNAIICAAALFGIALVGASLVDAFEVVLLPRPVRRNVRLNRYFFRATWSIWSRTGALLPAGRRREDFLGVYGPLSMVLLLSLWAACLILGFGLLQWALQMATGDLSQQSLAREIVLRGDAFFTLGYGDLVPRGLGARFLIILEAGTGFGFIALTVSYLPVLYQHFARRDVQLIELASRAGSPPSVATLLLWHGADGNLNVLEHWLRDWERWAAELIESHSSYPMLAFYRSQHEGHSWLASLAVVLDCCTLLLAGAKGGLLLQAAATFPVARRVLDQMTSALEVRPAPWNPPERLEAQAAAQLGKLLRQFPSNWRDEGEALRIVADLRKAYEPLLAGLSTYLLLPIPAWTATSTAEADLFGRERLIERLTRGSADME